jgi:uncharacterized membrane protein YjjB (DUF3815 family)
MCISSAAGFITTSLFSQYLPTFTYKTMASSTLSAFFIGTISNIYARFSKNVAVAPILSGILLQVPGSIGVRSSIGFFASGGDGETLEGIHFVAQMMFIGMCLAVGLFLASLLCWPFKGPNFFHFTI